LKEKFKDFKFKREYLWGIKEYEYEGRFFETLKCICYDKKCDICYKTNFIHIDPSYQIRPCNLRPLKFKVDKEDIKELFKRAVSYLKKQTSVPEHYKLLWGWEN